MNEMAIERHSFDVAKGRLRDFTEKTEAELKIDGVETDGGLFGLGNHKVTGEELNSRLEKIQKHLIGVNENNNKLMKEFREVYHTLDVLDRDYITSIVANVKAVEKTSNDVRVQQGVLKNHNYKLADQQNKLDVQQTEIEKNVTNISKIVRVLQDFKQKLEAYKHLTDIDKIWNDCKAIQNEIKLVSDSITNRLDEQISVIQEKIETIENSLQDREKEILKMQKLLDEINSFVAVLNGYSHLSDVDNMWEDLDTCKTNLDACKINIESINGNIQTHQTELDNLAAASEEHNSKFVECEKRDEELVSVIQKNKEEVNENIAEAVQSSNTAIEALTKKVKDAYWIAGGAAGLAIIELILLFMKVM